MESRSEGISSLMVWESASGRGGAAPNCFCLRPPGKYACSGAVERTHWARGADARYGLGA